MSKLSGSQSNSPAAVDRPRRAWPPYPKRAAGAPSRIRRGVTLLVAGLVALTLLGFGVRVAPALLADQRAAAVGPTAVAIKPSLATVTASPTPSPSASPARPTPAKTKPPAKAKPAKTKPAKAGKRKKIKVPATGPGVYRHAHESVRPASSRGTLKRYDVRVEKGLDIDPDRAALLIEKVLNDHRSWRGTGRWRFQLVSAGQPADLHVYIVTPGTTDQLCAPLLTRGEVSCQHGLRVVLNAKRWLLGVSYYGHDVAGYRRYLINHEVGHALGHNHVGCPGPGRPAPVMMQQTKGLGGCRKNPWPLVSGD